MTEADLFTLEELDQEPIYRDFWRPQGAGWAVGTVVPIPTGEKVIFVLTRRTERGPVERTFVQKLDELRPHLARSAFMSARLQLERARIASETLAALGLPALVLNEQGKVLAARDCFRNRKNSARLINLDEADTAAAASAWRRYFSRFSVGTAATNPLTYVISVLHRFVEAKISQGSDTLRTHAFVGVFESLNDSFNVTLRLTTSPAT